MVTTAFPGAAGLSPPPSLARQDPLSQMASLSLLPMRGKSWREGGGSLSRDCGYTARRTSFRAAGCSPGKEPEVVGLMPAGAALLGGRGVGQAPPEVGEGGEEEARAVWWGQSAQHQPHLHGPGPPEPRYGR